MVTRLRFLAHAGFFMVICLVGVVGCGSNAGGGPATSSSGGSNATLHVVAAENFWGSIAKQLGGDKVSVTSIITNPQTDPHDYEATPKDGRSLASAQYVILNGIGYDPWTPKLLSANPSSSRKVLEIGSLLGVQQGGNPHRWYSPDDVQKVINQITSDYKQLDAQDAAYFDQQRTSYESTGLRQYNSLVQQIKQKYSGTPVGASESIFTPLAESLGLKLLTPESFLDAISEGSDPTAQDKSTADQQIKNKLIKIFVYNSQNATPDVKNLVNEAKSANIPIVTITETLSPANATFQDWQSKQLQALADALAKAAGQ